MNLSGGTHTEVLEALQKLPFLSIHFKFKLGKQFLMSPDVGPTCQRVMGESANCATVNDRTSNCDLMSPMQPLLRRCRRVSCQSPAASPTVTPPFPWFICYISLDHLQNFLCCANFAFELQMAQFPQVGKVCENCYIPMCGGSKCFCFIRKTQGYAISMP